MSKSSTLPPILDVACGNRMFWFDKSHPDTLFLDNRTMQPIKVGKGRNARTRAVLPDKIMDFRKLELPNNHFSLVVFDPPHFNTLGANSYTAITYGRLNPITWKTDLAKGFAECFRVLKPNGVLIFKWNEYDIPVKEVLKLSPVKPLFGHIVAKTQRTHWVCFMKPNKSTANQTKKGTALLDIIRRARIDELTQRRNRLEPLLKKNYEVGTGDLAGFNSGINTVLNDDERRLLELEQEGQV